MSLSFKESQQSYRQAVSLMHFRKYCRLTIFICLSHQTYSFVTTHMHSGIFAPVPSFYVNDPLDCAVVSHPGNNKYVADEQFAPS